MNQNHQAVENTAQNTTDSKLEQLYAKRKNAHQMPANAKAELQQVMSEKLQSESNQGKSSSLLRHPALALAFSVVFVFSLVLNDWTDIEQQFAPPATPHYAPEFAFSPELEPSDYLADESEITDETTANDEANLSHETNLSHESNLNHEISHETNQSTEAEQVASAKFKAKQSIAKAKRSERDISTISSISSSQERIQVQGASNDSISESAPMQDSNLPPMRILVITAIDNQHIKLQDCQKETYSLARSLKPTANIGDKLMISLPKNQVLPLQLNNLASQLEPMAANLQCN